MLDLRFCTRAFSSCGERGPLFIAVCRPFTVAASLVAEHRLQSRRLSSSGPWAQLLRGMWDPPRPGLEPTSPALAGRLSTTAPPGKPLTFLIFLNYHFIPLLPVSNSFPFRCHYEPRLVIQIPSTLSLLSPAKPELKLSPFYPPVLHQVF